HRLLAAMAGQASQLSDAYPAEQRHLLADNGTLWRCVAAGLVIYLLLVAALGFLPVPLLIARPGYERPVRANKLLGVAAVRRATRRLHPALARNGERVPIGGPRLGRMHHAGIPLHASIEDSVLLVGPPGAGKGTGFVY